MRTAVVTLAHGRHAHLAGQARALTRSTVPADLHVVVAMADPLLPQVVPDADVVHVDRVHGALPLAAARNAGATRAIERGADLLVMLDVDCVPDPQLIARYGQAAERHDGVLSGPVGYLPPPPAGGYPDEALRALARPHPARPLPGEDEVRPAEDPDLFWSLSFALTPGTWQRVGGFCEDYYGYGGEDTDFGRLLVTRRVPSWWVGGAWAYHQHHDDPGVPVRHLDDVLRNAGVFFDRWGSWPMEGWLQEFARRGLAHVDAHGRWVRT